MTLASLEASRHKKRGSTPTDPLQWTSNVSTAQLNQILARTMEKREFRVEPCHRLEIELGFGLRVINTGRTMVFETARWKDPVVDSSMPKPPRQTAKPSTPTWRSLSGPACPTKQPAPMSKPAPSNCWLETN